jgi:hypothetical protein
MNDAKYIGLDVHQATISVAVRDSKHTQQIDQTQTAPCTLIFREGTFNLTKIRRRQFNIDCS